MDDSKRKADYKKSANEYWRWKDAGNNLLIAANILQDNYNRGQKKIKKAKQGLLPLSMYVLSQIIYFKAKSLELYLKALYIKRGNPATDNNGNLVSFLNSHKLLDLSQATGELLDEEHKLLLVKLTEAIIYWGTYPVPLNHRYWRPNVAGVSGIMPIYTWNGNENQNLDIILTQVFKDLDK